MDDQNAFLTFVQKRFAHDIAGAVPAQPPREYSCVSKSIFPTNGRHRFVNIRITRRAVSEVP
jgi:hypothetical protein